MKYLVVSVILASAGFATGAHAACTPASQVKGSANLRALLADKTVCAVQSGKGWQEFHRADGALIDYKRGPSHRTDPTKRVGTWSVAGSGSNTQLTHAYSAGETYRFTVHADTLGTTYSFCSGSNELPVQLRSGQGPC